MDLKEEIKRIENVSIIISEEKVKIDEFLAVPKIDEL